MSSAEFATGQAALLAGIARGMAAKGTLDLDVTCDVVAAFRKPELPTMAAMIDAFLRFMHEDVSP